jgi:AcrR family transcriptional regulator
VSRDKAAADQRRRILDATAELVAEKGYQGATIELIVRRAKVGYQTFYKSFEDKEAAFLVLVEEAIEGLEKRVKQAYEREREWPDQIAAGLGALFEEVAANPDVAHACLVEAITAGPKAAALQEGALKRFAPLLKPGRELNPRRAQLPDTLEDTLMGGVIWVVNQRLIAGEAEKLRALLPETLEFVLRPYVGEEVAAREAGTAAGASAG